MPLLLFWGRRVDHSSIFCDVRTEHDPAYECLVTDLVRITLRSDQKARHRAAPLTNTGFLLEATGISYPLLTNTYHEGRGSVRVIQTLVSSSATYCDTRGRWTSTASF